MAMHFYFVIQLKKISENVRKVFSIYQIIKYSSVIAFDIEIYIWQYINGDTGNIKEIPGEVTRNVGYHKLFLFETVLSKLIFI